MNYHCIGYKYDIISKIGEGGFGVVYKARDIRKNQIVTIKQIKKKIQPNEEIPQYILREMDILEEFKGCSNIIDLRDFQLTNTNENVYFVYDYYEYDIQNLIYQREPMTMRQVKSYMKQMIIALLTVHSKNYIHGDIKPNNFIISSKNEIKLIDFGVSLKADKNNKSTKIGTYGYNAPELILGDTEYGIEIDIWSLGCTFYEMMTKNKLIYHCYSNSEIADQIIQIFDYPNKNDFPQFFSLPNAELFLNCMRISKSSVNDFFDKKLPNEFKPMKNLLIQMLQLNPKKRISLEDALDYPELRDAELPKNLPRITFAELDHCKSSKHKLSSNLNKKMIEKLRLTKIVPPSLL